MNKYDGHTPGPWISDPIEGCVVGGASEYFKPHPICLLAKPESNPFRDADEALILDAPRILAQRDEAVALLRRASEWICSLPSIPDNEGAATMLVTRINDFLSGPDSKGEA